MSDLKMPEAPEGYDWHVEIRGDYSYVDLRPPSWPLGDSLGSETFRYAPQFPRVSTEAIVRAAHRLLARIDKAAEIAERLGITVSGV